MKRRFFTLLAVVSLAGLLAACDSSAENKQETESESAVLSAEVSVETGDTDETEAVTETETEVYETEGLGEVDTIYFEHETANGCEYGIVTAVDADGNTVWSYRTEDYEMMQCSLVSEVGLNGSHYYLVEDRSILCLNAADGTQLWRNEEYGGCLAMQAFAFDEAGNLYITGYMGPDLFACDSDGHTLANIDSFDSDNWWPYEVSLNGRELSITFESSGNTEIINIDDFSRIQ